MAKGAFIVTKYRTSEHEIEELSISPDAPESAIPPEQAELVPVFLSIDEILRIYYLKNKRPETYTHYLNELVLLAQMAIGSEECHPKLAKSGLEIFKSKILNREGRILKSGYMKDLGLKALIFGGLPLVMGIVLDFSKCYQFICANCLASYNLPLLWTGTMLGVWISFAISRPSLSFEELAIMEKDYLSPELRLLFTGALSVVFFYLFIEQAVVIKFGSLSTTDISKYPISAFLIGVILGINEKILGSTLIKKTKGLD